MVSSMMTLADGWLLAKKIAIGIVITIVPLIILAGGLWLTRQMTATHANDKKTSSQVTSDAN
jgi:hypothetical protein